MNENSSNGSLKDSGGDSKKRKEKWRLPAALTIVIDVLIGAFILLLFYVTQVVMTPEGKGEALAPSKSVAGYVTPSAAETPGRQPGGLQTAQTSPAGSASIDPGDWRAKFAKYFSSDGKVHQDDHSYQSPNIYVDITKKKENGVTYFKTEIYVAELKYFRTSFATGEDTMGSTEFVHNILQKAGGVVAINADYSIQNWGLTIRNGKYFNNKQSSKDILVMYNDGTMKTFAGGYDWDEIKAQDPWQTWGFGPMLLDSDSQPMTKFNTNVANYLYPRSAIGCYEPGHYCFITVEGRQPGYSEGYNLTQLSQLMYNMGCKVAFNLDGGASAQLAFLGETYSHPCGSRQDADIIYITDKD